MTEIAKPTLNRWIFIGCFAFILGTMGLLPRLALPPGILLISIAGIAFNVLVMVGAVFRARRFPDERSAWHLMALCYALLTLGNVFIGLRNASLDHYVWQDTFIIAFQGGASLLLPLAIIRLPLMSQHPEGYLTNLLGGLLFGGSLAFLLWVLNLPQAAGHLAFPSQTLLIIRIVRTALIGGASAYLFFDSPARLRGPLFWLLLSAGMGTWPFIVNDLQLSRHPQGPISWVLPLGFLGQVFTLMVTLSRDPVEVPSNRPLKRSLFFELFIYIPYTVSAILLLRAITRDSGQYLMSMLAFLGVTTLLVIHQFFLLREVIAARFELDLRVQERTRVLEKTQDVLIRMERMNTLSIMGAGIVHDLNNALTATLTGVQCIRIATGHHQEPSDDLLRNIEVSAQQSATLSNRLMNFARQGLEGETQLDLRNIIQEEQELLKVVLSKKINLELRLDSGTYPLQGRRGQIQQVLVNLLANARDAISGTGHVSVSLSRETPGKDAIACLEISDSGTGMPTEVMEHLFQPMFTTKAAGKGTGLGLASVKVIIEQMNGTIAVQSTPGLGTTFTIKLPLAA